MASGFGRLCVSVLLATRLVASPLQSPVEPSDAYSRSVALLKLAYPELTGQGLVMLVNGEWTDFDAPPLPLLGLGITVAHRVANSHDAPRPLLTPRILWSVEPHTLIRLDVSGGSVDDPRRPQVRQFWLREPPPSADDVLAKLADLNAKFVTEARMREHASPQLARISPLLGRIELQEISFAPDGPFWRATVFISTPTGRREYAVLFEPFEGRLVSIGGLR